MVNPINYEEKRFIIVNDISKTLFYFFDFDTRSNSRHMEFEHFHSYYEIHILLSSNALHFIKGIPYHIQMVSELAEKGIWTGCAVCTEWIGNGMLSGQKEKYGWENPYFD